MASLADAVAFFAASPGTGDFVFAGPVDSYRTPGQANTDLELIDGLFYSYFAQDSVSTPVQREWGRALYNAITQTFVRMPYGGVDNGVSVGNNTPINFSTAPVIAVTALAEDFVPTLISSTIYFQLNPLNWSPANQKPAVFFVATDGNDNNDGSTPAKALATLARALEIATRYNYEGLAWPWIQFAPGTYYFTQTVVLPPMLNAYNFFNDNTGVPTTSFLSGGNPGDVVFSSANQPFSPNFTIGIGAQWYVAGITIDCRADAFATTSDCQINLWRLIFDSSNGFGQLGVITLNNYSNSNISNPIIIPTTIGSFGTASKYSNLLVGGITFAPNTVSQSPVFQASQYSSVTAVTFTNGNTLTGTAIQLSDYSSVAVTNGDITTLPGQFDPTQLDDSCRVKAYTFSPPFIDAYLFNTTSGPPIDGTNLVAFSWGVYKDSTQANVGTGIGIFADDGGSVRSLTSDIASNGNQFDTTSNTLADIPELTVNVGDGYNYQFNATLFTTSNVAAGVQAAVGGTCTTFYIIYEGETTNAAGIAAQTRAFSLGTSVGAVTAVTAARIDITGTIAVNAGGTLTIQFAQNLANGAASSVLAGSYMSVQQLPT